MLFQRYFYVNVAYFISIVRFCADTCSETNVSLNEYFLIISVLWFWHSSWLYKAKAVDKPPPIVRGNNNNKNNDYEDKCIFKAVVIVVVVMASVMSANAGNPTNYVKNDEMNGEQLVAKTIYRNEDGHLFRHLRYTYTYDSENRVVCKEGFTKWDSVKSMLDSLFQTECILSFRCHRNELCSLEYKEQFFRCYKNMEKEHLWFEQRFGMVRLLASAK